MPNYAEYYQPPVTRKEQVSLRSPEGKELKRWVETVVPTDLDGFKFCSGKRITARIPKESGVYFASYEGLPVSIRSESRISVKSLIRSILTPATVKRE
jgi:hypothetical protein